MKEIEATVLVKNLIFTLSHELGNKLVPLKYFLEKMEEGDKLTAKEEETLFDAYRQVENTLKWFQHLDPSELASLPCQTDKTGLISLMTPIARGGPDPHRVS